MRITPPSSLGFHEKADEILKRLEETDKKAERIIYELLELNRRQSQRIDEVNYKLDALSHKIDVQNRQLKLYSEGILKKDNETMQEAKIRFFKNIPAATGELRVFQLANAKIMNSLHSICKENDIKYWFGFGALLGAYVRNGSIPWDDDIDICMMREDVIRLIDLLRDNEEYQVTVVYDWYVSVIQYRFCSRDEQIPCFVDIAVFDWAADKTDLHEQQLIQLRKQLMDEIAGNANEFTYWNERKYLFAQNSGYSIQYDSIDRKSQNEVLAQKEEEKIKKIFEKYQSKAFELGVLCDKEAATTVAYALNNILDVPGRCMLWPVDWIFPIKEIPYESEDVCIPNKTDTFLDECFTGWPYLPQDILGGHNHFDKNILKKSEIFEKLKKLLD